MMGSGLIDKVLGFLKKDPDSAISKEAQQVLEKIPSLDLNELLRDIKSAKLLAEINKDPNNADNFIQLAEYYKNHKKIDNAINIYLSIAQRELENQNFLQSSNYIQMAMNFRVAILNCILPRSFGVSSHFHAMMNEHVDAVVNQCQSALIYLFFGQDGIEDFHH